MNKNNLINYSILFVLNSLWVVLLLIIASKYQARTPTTYVVDVARIMASYTQVVSAAADNDLDAQVSLVKASKDIKQSIRSIVGDSVVLVSASVVTGNVIDITDSVVTSLGLTPVSADKVKPYSVEFLPEIDKEIVEFDPDNLRKIYNEIYEKEALENEQKEAELKLKKKIENIIP